MASNVANTTTKPGVLAWFDQEIAMHARLDSETDSDETAATTNTKEARATVERLAAATKRLLEAYDDSASEFEAAAAAQQARDALAAFRGEG